MAASLYVNVQELFAVLSSKNPHRGAQAAQLASDLYQLCIESVSDTELAYCTSVLFGKENGVLKFLRESATLEEFASCKEELLRLLDGYIKNLREKVLPYAVEIKDVCMTLFVRDKSSKVKNATFPPLCAVLELCVRSPVVEQLNVPKIAEKFFQACHHPTKHSSTVRGGIFQVLGTLSEVYPECMVAMSERLVDIYIKTLKSEMLSKQQKKKPDMPVIGGCLRGLGAYLTQFSQSVAEGSAHAQDIYKFTRMAIDTNVSMTRYEVPRAGLTLIGKHAAQFKEYLAKDHEYMYRTLLEWSLHNNRDNAKLALAALEAFIQQVSLFICEGTDKVNATIFREFIQRFRAIIDNQGSRHKELSVAIKGYGYFAAPCKVFMKPEDLYFMFSEMVQRSEQLFFTPIDTMDERLFHLPLFLEALASIVKEVDEVSESFMTSLEKLMVLLFECFSILPLNFHKQTFFAVLKLILGISPNRTALKTFLSHVVYHGLICTCSHPPVFDVGDGSAVVSVEGGDVLGNKRASYRDYVDLWKHLVDPTKLRDLNVEFQEVGMRQAVQQIIYDEVISAVLKIIDRLNLSSKTQLYSDNEPTSSESPTSASTTTPARDGAVIDRDSPLSSPPPPSIVTSDPVIGLQATVPKDFHIFINLVDLCRVLLPSSPWKMFEPWVHTFGREMITHSSSHPHVSGFYKMLATCFKVCKLASYFKEVNLETGMIDSENDTMETDVSDKQACFVLFQKFVREVLVRMKQYKDDLLASCLQLLLSLPKELVELEFVGLVSALQMTFKLGLSYLPLANAGLDALELWSSELPPKLLQPHFKHILPYLDDYLRTLSNVADSDVDSSTVTVASRSSRGRKMPVKVIDKWKEGIEGAESPLNKVRRRIVHFLGALGGQINTSLVETESAAAYAAKAVAWDSKNRLEFALPFQDMKPTLYLDPFIPRICELATSSSDRQTKIAACELLHALILFIVGKSAQPAMMKKSPMTKLYKKIFPIVLQLACDVERVAEQLFRPLVFQMIHWFTRNTQYESPDTIALLDSILDGIVHPTDTSLRDFCAICVREFLAWSIKQTTKKQQEKSPINTKSLLKRIYSLAKHPGASKRLGAALAINSIYTVFREEDSLVDMFVMEMLVVMIESLRLAHKDDKSLGTREQACQSIDHLCRIIKVKSSKLVTPTKTRRVPKGLKSADISNLVGWLLSQCGSPETDCRLQCRKLFIQFTVLVPKIATATVWIRRTIESEGGLYFVSRFEAGGQGHHAIQKAPVLKGPTFSQAETVGWLDSIAAALDCYNWVLKEQLFSPSELFDALPRRPKEKPSNLFQSLEFFVHRLALHNIEAAVKCFETSHLTVHTPREIDGYNRVKCSVILKLMNFTSILLEKHPNQAFSHVPESFWSEQLFKLVSACCMRPVSVGFNSGNIATFKKLPLDVFDVLKAFECCLKPKLKSTLVTILAIELSPGSCCDLIGQLPFRLRGDMDQTKDYRQLNDTISGLLLLQKSNLLLPSLKEAGHPTDNLVSKLLESIFLTLRPLVSKKQSSAKASTWCTLSPANKQSTELVLELALNIEVTPSQLVDCLMDVNTGCDGLGAMLYQFYPALVNGHFLTEYELFISHLVGSSDSNPEIVSTVLCGFLDHIARDKILKKKYATKVCHSLLSQWSQLRGWWGERFDSDRRLASINILKKIFNLQPKVLVHVSTEPSHAEAVVSMYTVLIKETQSSLAFKSKVFEVLHHFTSLSEKHLEQIKSSINMLIARQFPLKSTEFLAGSPQYNEYTSVIEKLLSAMVVSGSVMLLEVLISIMCREKRHVHEEQIQSSLVNFVSELSTTTAKSAVDVAYKVFTNEQSFPPEARRAACERVCLPLLRCCSEQTVRDFFIDHIKDITDVIEANLSKTAVESHLVSKLCCFQLVEVLYSRLPAGALSNAESKINSAYCKGSPKSGKELTQAVTKAGHAAKSEDLHGNKTHYELRRQYHCMAYNMVMAIISCTQQQAQFYTVFLFKEDPGKGQMLWDNLIDFDKQYSFETELETPMYRKKQMTAIRDKVRSQDSRESSPADSPPFPPRYLSSQYLADSSLSTDVSQFDFSSGTHAVPQIKMSASEPQETSSYVVTEEQIEQDELNQHECMLPLMKLLDHMEHNKINPQVPKGTTPTEMPQWMTSMHKKFNSGKTHQNIRLFLARLITNRPKVFQPYAKYWLPGLTQLIIGGRNGGGGIHYFIVDVVVTMLSWSTSAVLDDQHLASRLLQYLMEQAHHDNRSVFRNNLEIIKTLVECWKDNLQAPTKVIFSQFSQPGAESSKANRTGIQLLGVVVANGMSPFDQDTAGYDLDEKKFYSTFVSLMSHKYKEVYAASAEVLGMVLAYMKEKKELLTLETLEEVVVQQLSSLIIERNEDKFLTCLQKLQTYYPKLTERFAEKLLFLLPKFYGLFKSMCLEVLQPLADIRPKFYMDLKDKGFHDMLTFRDEPTQIAALKIVQGMVQYQTLSLQQTSALLPLVTAFGSHPSQSCRLIMYDTLITLYTNYNSTNEDSPSDEAKGLLADVRDQLLQGMADDAESIRLKMFAFWNVESRLSSDTLGRLTQLLAVLYSTNTERHFLYHSTNLLLELTSRSPDFNRSIFDSPLSECKFEDYTGIDLSWQQRYLQMTPLFAATQTSVPGGTQMEQSLGGNVASGAIRATQQGMVFTPTQDMSGGSSGYNWMAPSLQSQDVSFSMGSMDTSGQDSTQSSLLFNTSKMKPPKRSLRRVGKDFGLTKLKPDGTSTQDPQEMQRREIMKLKRRFIRDRKISSDYYAKTQARKNIARQEYRQRQKAARDSQVVMYRKYRVGELPDIQIKHSELIRPFQALAQHDSTLARMLFSLLYESVYVQVDSVLTDREAEATKKAVKDGLNMVMEKSVQFHPPFIGSLQDICFREKQLELEPTSVSRACLTCMQEPIGIMLLEKQLLNSGDADLGPRPAKRARGASAPLPEGTTAWVELARLYKSLGDFDSLCSIFSSQIGTKPITSDALEAEERRDYPKALQLYKEAISCESWEDGQPLQVEEDFWDDSLLQCYSHLTEWQDLEKAALVNLPEPSRLENIWEDSYYIEHYLPHIMHSKLKLACSGLDDENFSKFLDKALQDTKQRALLESEYCTELALYCILKDDLDRARYYTGLCLQSFLQEWSNIDKLLVKSRATRLQSLQALAEMQEYLDLMAKTTNFESTVAVDKLMNKWRSRFPHPKLDPIKVWDDVITTRCMMMRKILEHFHSLLTPATSSLADSMEVDGEGGRVDITALQQIFSREFTCLYLKMANTARFQCNYAVAKRYLQLTEAAVGEHFPSDTRLQLDWMHSVAEMRVQQAEQDPSPNHIKPLVALVDRLDGYSSEDILTTDHNLAMIHYSLQGRAFDQLAKAFLDQDDGELLMNVLQDSHVYELNKAIGFDPNATPTQEEISHKLLIRCMGSLKSGVKSSNAEYKASGNEEGMVKALVELATFCDEQLRLKEDEDIDSPLDTSTFPSVVVTYTLKAMQHNSKSATQQLPRLLQIVEIYPETMEKFKSKSGDVPNWMFITWISQLVALLDKEEGAAIHDILISLATDYPQALHYPFKISSCNFKFGKNEVGRANQEAMTKLNQLLKNELVDDFVVALELLSSPELIFKDYCDNDLKPLMEATVPKRKSDQVKKIWRQFLEQLQAWDTGSSSSLYAESGGSVSIEVGARQRRFAKDFLKKIEDKFGKDGAKLHNMQLKDFTNFYNSLFDQMKPALNKTTGSALMKDYSPWLQNFQANQYSELIEIPGQYDGKSKPLPEYHVKISGFDEKVLVMSSLRKPKRITIRGDDEREYMFLIKGGEDLRVDQRIEQVYETMNSILNEDSACSQRELCLRTYQVIPMTPRVGLIEWMKNTKPLKDFLQDALTEEERKRYLTASKWHNEWLGKYGKSPGEWYRVMYRKAQRTEVEKEYRRKVTCIPWDLLRRAFMQLASSPEAFLTLRSHFIQTMASMSMCQYVLGIGDRHLSNFMVDMESGGIIGIDFGHAFGTATQFLPFPELIPFRMSPQITNVVLPHTGSGKLKCCMVHTLRALRNSPRLLLNTMDVFVKEPSLDWKSNARKQIKIQKLSQERFSTEGVWYPKEKIRQAKKKLQGYNPAHVMLTELTLGHEKTTEFPALKKILLGDKVYNKRAQVGQRCSSVEEQVACLIDHATDPNILGRTYLGWEPWV